jgi:NAD(P)-dependent dehydrogenase (short-subunit alcohol dehydrogenase family)
VADSRSFGAFAAALRATLQTTFGRENFDYLVNNAGIGINAPFAETTEEQFDELVRIQLKAPFFLSQELLAMLAEGAGRRRQRRVKAIRGRDRGPGQQGPRAPPRRSRQFRNRLSEAAGGHGGRYIPADAIRALAGTGAEAGPFAVPPAFYPAGKRPR